jgi:hypothetical protein
MRKDNLYMNRRLLYTFILSITFTVLSVAAFAQAAPNSSGAFEPVTDVPVDGGIALLVAGGIGYGVKKLYDRKK